MDKVQSRGLSPRLPASMSHNGVIIAASLWLATKAGFKGGGVIYYTLYSYIGYVKTGWFINAVGLDMQDQVNKAYIKSELQAYEDNDGKHDFCASHAVARDWAFVA